MSGPGAAGAGGPPERLGAAEAAGPAGAAGADVGGRSPAGRDRRGLSILDEDDDDPMLSAVNLVDVFLVLVVALLTAVAAQSQAGGDVTTIRNPGRPDMEITVREQGREIRFKGTGTAAEGGGVRAGVAYRLPDGNIVYVPEAGGAAAPGAPASADAAAGAVGATGADAAPAAAPVPGSAAAPAAQAASRPPPAASAR